ncbi:MAG: hypothetical protein ABI556_02055 [Gemmatimonadales bacterium]
MFDPRALFMLVVLVAVTGYVAKGLMVAWYKLHRGERPAGNSMNEMEDRLRKVEAATSSLLVDVSSMREKERFMARLQAGAAPAALAPAASETPREGEASPMVIQSMPAIPRAGSRH